MKKSSIVIGSLAILITVFSAGVAVGDVVNLYKDGDTLTADSLNKNFADLDARSPKAWGSVDSTRELVGGYNIREVKHTSSDPTNPDPEIALMFQVCTIIFEKPMKTKDYAIIGLVPNTWSDNKVPFNQSTSSFDYACIGKDVTGPFSFTVYEK